MAKRTKKKPIEEAGKVAVVVGLAGAAGYGIYRLLQEEGVIPCKPGDTKCKDYDLYTCSVEGKWVLTEEDNIEICHYPEPPPTEWKDWNEELGRKSFSVSITEVPNDWKDWNEELGRRAFSIEITEAPPLEPYIESITPDPCWRGGTIIINGRNLSGNYTWIHLSKAIVGYPEITVIPDTSTATKLTLDLSRDTGPPTYVTIGNFLGPGRVMVEVMVIRDSKQSWSNEIGLDLN